VGNRYYRSRADSDGSPGARAGQGSHRHNLSGRRREGETTIRWQDARGWEGNTRNWRVEDGAIVAGALDRKQPHNEFLATTEAFGNFDLRLQYKIEGANGFVNGGVQFWSQRIPDNFEVSGYQADLGADTDGNLYDESRRNKNLATAPAEARKRVLKLGAWNDYRIRAEGAHIQIWLNSVKTVDYTENDGEIPHYGKVALQIHGGAYTKVRIVS